MHHATKLSALFLLSATALWACGETDTLTGSDETLTDTAEASVASALDGEPSHPLRLDCAAVSTSTATVPGGHREGGRGKGGHGRGHGERLAWVYDADGSGDLDATEQAAQAADRLAGCEARKARLLAAYDADGDGTLSDEERAVAQAALDAEREARKAELLATYDADGDGALSREEREALREARQAELIATYDTDGDGALSDAEKVPLAEAIRAAIRAGERPVRA